jgi:hypothetical protein
LPSKRHRHARFCVVLLLSLPLLAQTQPEKSTNQQTVAPQSLPADAHDVPEVTGLSTSLHGWNGGATLSGVHSSTTGWATVFTPAVGYSFSDTFSIDATIPIYIYRLAQSRVPNPPPAQLLVSQRGETGDVVVGLNAQFAPRPFDYQLTGAFTAPTGDKDYGLSTGRVTFDVNNHFERTFGRFTPNIEIGAGDSSTLVNRVVTKNYTSLGPLAHFQAGLGIDLLRGIVFEADAYEQLPIGDQKIYGPSHNGRATVVTGHNVSEDNGFLSALDVPINSHVTFSGYYSRSLRLYTDTAAIGVSYVLRAAPADKDSSMDDLFR